MCFAFLLISIFIGNGITVDDLGLLLAMVAVVILIMGVIYRAARVFAWMIIPDEYRNAFLRRGGAGPADIEESSSRAYGEEHDNAM